MYKLNNAKYEDICRHLKSCNQLFIPNLSDRVDILKYSNKIQKEKYNLEIENMNLKKNCEKIL